jgi:hypothetical protein
MEQWIQEALEWEELCHSNLAIINIWDSNKVMAKCLKLVMDRCLSNRYKDMVDLDNRNHKLNKMIKQETLQFSLLLNISKNS